MRVAHLVEQGKPLKVTTIEKPTPGPKDVLVKVEAACLVPNSANIVTKGPGQHYVLPKLPSAFGLDAAGVIEAVGENVIGLKVGDRVYVDPYITCGTCHQCRRGRLNGMSRNFVGFANEGQGGRTCATRHACVRTSVLEPQKERQCLNSIPLVHSHNICCHLMQISQ